MHPISLSHDSNRVRSNPQLGRLGEQIKYAFDQSALESSCYMQFRFINAKHRIFSLFSLYKYI